jgi:glycerol-3-phosphate dehydrogenase
VPLPGAEAEPDFVALARQIPLPPALLERVWRRLGSRLHQVFADAGPAELAPICRAEGVTAAELRYSVQVEQCRTLEDVRRHTHLGAGPCDGLECAAPAAHVLAELLDWSPDRIRAEVRTFFDERWSGRRPVLTGRTLAQEELLRASVALAQ